jgi:hypothetical protein
MQAPMWACRAPFAIDYSACVAGTDLAAARQLSVMCNARPTAGVGATDN